MCKVLSFKASRLMSIDKQCLVHCHTEPLANFAVSYVISPQQVARGNDKSTHYNGEESIN